MKFEFRVENYSQNDLDKWRWCLWQENADNQQNLPTSAKKTYLPSRKIAAPDLQYFELNLNDIAEGALHVAAQVNDLEQNLVDPAARAAFRFMFANANSIKDEGNLRPAWVRFEDTEDKPNALRAAAVFYQGIYLYLHDDDRFTSFNADLALLLAAWQWYTAFSRLLSEKYEAKPGEIDLYQYGQAHKILAALLEDNHFDLASQWMAFLRNSSDTLPLARERFRTGMVLEYSSAPKKLRSLHHALAAPGAFEPINWANTQLLPVLFNNDGGKALVRRLISDWLLVRYDFWTSLHMARLLKRNKPQAHLWQGWVMLAWLLFWATGMLSINGLTHPQPSILGNFTTLGWSMFTFIGGPAVLIFMAWLWFEPGALVNLALPRLSGGIALGYVAFILQKDAIELALRFLEPFAIPLFFLWIGALLLGYAYLYFDVLPRSRTRNETFRRASLTLVVALLISMGMGLFMVALSTAAYSSCELPWGCLSAHLVG